MVSKNLSVLRKRANFTQDALAEKLHVTRQAVSNWETGKCQPDVETLTALSEALGCDITELIYGAKPAPYRRYARRYIVWTAVLGALVLIFLGCEIWLVPYLNAQTQVTFDLLRPLYYRIFARPIGYAAMGSLLIAALSLWADLRLPKIPRVVCTATGFLVVLLWLLFLFIFFVSICADTAPPWWPFFSPIFRFFMTNPGTRLITCLFPFLGGVALFLGAEK